MKNFAVNMGKAAIVAFSSIVLFLMGVVYGNKKHSNTLKAYDSYNRVCEAVLDSLSMQYEGFDAFEEGDTYNDYLNAREELNIQLYGK